MLWHPHRLHRRYRSDDAHLLVGGQVCGPPGLMKFVSGGKAKDKSQGEVSKRCSQK